MNPNFVDSPKRNAVQNRSHAFGCFFEERALFQNDICWNFSIRILETLQLCPIHLITTYVEAFVGSQFSDFFKTP